MSFIEFDGKRIFYEKKGRGAPILFGHSYLWDSEMWFEVTEILKEDYCCVLVDLPGHGQSEGISDLSLETLSNIHKAVMLNLGFKEFSLVGLSIGAMWGSLLCLEKDVEVSKFVIMNSSLLSEPSESKNLYLGMLDVIESSGHIPEPIIVQIAPGFFSPEYVSKFLEPFKGSLRAFSGESLKSVISSGRAFVNRQDLLSGFKAYKNDTLIIAGEYDHYRSLKEAEGMAQELELKLVVVQAGHISAKEVPLDIACRIKSFLMEA